MLGADLVGFQTAAGRSNFLRLAARLLGLRRSSTSTIDIDGRTVVTGPFPISIDFDEMQGLAVRARMSIDRARRAPRRSRPSGAR